MYAARHRTQASDASAPSGLLPHVFAAEDPRSDPQGREELSAGKSG